AIIQHFQIDRVYFVGTNRSMWDNLVERFGGDDEYQLEVLEKKEGGRLREEDLKRLEGLIDRSLGGEGSRCFIVKDGENDGELWNIFEKFLEVLDHVERGDLLYLDITHLFRSLSVMSFVIAEFGKIVHEIEIGGVFYGMFKKGEPSKLINVAMFFQFLEWAKAFDELDRFASFKRLISLTQGRIPPNAHSIINGIEWACSIANMSEIYRNLQRLATHLYFEESEDRVISFLAPRFKEFVRRLNKRSLGEFQFALAQFFSERENSALGYVALAEAIVTKIGEEWRLDEKALQDQKEREKIREWIREGFAREFPKSHPGRQLATFSSKIGTTRNNICHQLENSKNAKHDLDLENLPH
ncbi:MAG: TIGR02221 family CRISPR-associated protein, partial [Nitratiruptor sp.]|nr:TIGR02221 family CRISPR-associated protein [Nitratiruptor sp.]NPA84034.1 TIGR02221 family CRISPR-associated protein [Campylobacterota bacterium]